MRKNVLIVEDNEKIRMMIKMYFRNDEFNILEAETGEDALLIFKIEHIDLILLDIMLPLMNGINVCNEIRRSSDVPIIMITAKTQDEDVLQGYECGADEYVTKPFNLKILSAKVNALLKRIDGVVCKGENIIQIDNLTYDFCSEKVEINGKEILLTRKEVDLLAMLLRNRGTILTKEQLLDRVWGFEYEGGPRTVDTHIKRLRGKLGEYECLIKTYRGRGYRID